jgi:hypothetical protein
LPMPSWLFFEMPLVSPHSALSSGHDESFTDRHNMARGISSIATTAMVAGAIGFGAGVYLVPNEKADQFRTMVDGGLGAIYRVVHADKANRDVAPSESSQTKPPGETSRIEAQPDVPAQPRADAQCDPGDPACGGGLPVDAAAPPAITDHDAAASSSSPPEQDDRPSGALTTDPYEAPGISDRDTQSSSPPEQDDRPSHALNSDPSGIAPPNSSPNIETDAPTPVAPETPKKKHPAKKMKPKSSPSE